MLDRLASNGVSSHGRRSCAAGSPLGLSASVVEFILFVLEVTRLDLWARDRVRSKFSGTLVFMRIRRGVRQDSSMG
jgi:hypothetical protein